MQYKHACSPIITLKTPKIVAKRSHPELHYSVFLAPRAIHHYLYPHLHSHQTQPGQGTVIEVTWQVDTVPAPLEAMEAWGPDSTEAALAGLAVAAKGMRSMQVVQTLQAVQTLQVVQTLLALQVMQVPWDS